MGKKYSYKGFSAFAITVVIVLAIILVGVGTVITNFIGNYYKEESIVITVKDKERVANRDGDGAKYLIWSEDGETFENVDSLFKGKFNSSDLYGQLERGKKYKCKVYGFRSGFWSMYRNLISCSEYKNE